MNDQVTPNETAEILRLAEQAFMNNAEGEFVELGCYRGDTSVLLAKLLQKLQKLPSNSPRLSVTAVENHVEKYAKNPVENSQIESDEHSKTAEHPTPVGPPEPASPRCLWIYDSFAGLPEKTREDASGAGANFKAGELLVTKREVIEKLRKHGLKTSSSSLSSTTSAPAKNQNSTTQQALFSVIVKKAWFDDLTEQDLPGQIAFAFCDGDLYSSIKTSLRLVEPRLTEQGIIIVHDYNNPELPGSARAVDEFLKTHPDFTIKFHYTLAILKRIS